MPVIFAVYEAWTNSLSLKNEALLYSFGIIILLLLVIMIIISLTKSRRVKVLQRINEVAEETNQLKNAFIANMTHEIRTPLNAIVGFTTMLAEMDDLDKETRMAFLKEINENKDSLLQLVNDLLDYSKIEAHTLEFNDEEVDVNALINEVCATENAHPHPTGMQVEFAEKLPQCRLVVDRVRFAQVISNLVRNALKFTEAGAGSTRVIEFRFHFGIFGIDADAARDATALGNDRRMKAVELCQGVERNVTAATHYFGEVGFGVCRRVSVRLATEFFECQTGFVDGTCRRVVYVFPENRERTPHGEGLEGKDNLYARTVGDALYQGEVLPQQVFLHYIARGRKKGKVYHIYYLFVITESLSSPPIKRRTGYYVQTIGLPYLNRQFTTIKPSVYYN